MKPIPTARPTAQWVGECSDTVHTAPAPSSKSPERVVDDTVSATIAAASPARDAANSRALPTQTGTRRLTPRRNAAVSMRPIWSA